MFLLTIQFMFDESSKLGFSNLPAHGIPKSLRCQISFVKVIANSVGTSLKAKTTLRPLYEHIEIWDVRIQTINTESFISSQGQSHKRYKKKQKRTNVHKIYTKAN
jgi:hypothetical protein